MTIPRDIIDVHLQIYNVIPEENIEFKNELKKYINSILNIAPECRISARTYVGYSIILSKYIQDVNENDSNWKNQVINIFSGKYNS
jgi:hypothetical protein